MALSDKQLAKLCVKLEVPIVFRHALEDKRRLDDNEIYAIHEALSDMQPDTALLSMALSAEQIFFALPPDMPEAVDLVMETDRIVSFYGGLWLARTEQEDTVPEAFVLEALSRMPEDLRRLK